MTTITIPKPAIHTGPEHLTVDEATVDYLRAAAERVRTKRIWGSGVSALVSTVLDDVAAAVSASGEPHVQNDPTQPATAAQIAAERFENRLRWHFNLVAEEGKGSAYITTGIRNAQRDLDCAVTAALAEVERRLEERFCDGSRTGDYNGGLTGAIRIVRDYRQEQDR